VAKKKRRRPRIARAVAKLHSFEVLTGLHLRGRGGGQMQDDAGDAACAIERLETKKAGDELRLKPQETDKPSCIKNYSVREG
jgi:hypothetical protein